MTLPLTSVVIPFRDRGTDPLRALNLSRVLDHWESFDVPKVVSDGRIGSALFNRSAAYNRGIKQSDPDTEVFIFAESDMLCPFDQIVEGIRMAEENLGMVVPFDTYWYHTPENSELIRQHPMDPGCYKPKWVMDNCRSIGAINIVSRRTLDTIGRYDERFEGNWYDDDAVKLAYEFCAGPTWFVTGIAHHLYHLPGHRGAHLHYTEREATRRNQQRLSMYEQAVKENNMHYMRRLLRGDA